MSFEVKLQTSKSPTNAVTKSVSNVLSVTGTLRAGTSIIDPVILIETSNTAIASTSINYMEIATFGRKYFITNIISIKNNLWEVHGHVDVLSTYAASIKEQNAIVARQEKDYNLYLDDGFFMSYQNSLVQTLNFSVAAPFESSEFVLIVAGS